MKHNYHERKQNRIDNAHRLAAKHEAAADARHNAANEIAKFIPPGQPILVGHHSEKRHRRDLAKIDNNMRKSIEAQNTAKYYDEKAQAIENNTAISSDDPEAIEKLTAKVAALQAHQEFMKQANTCIRKKDQAAFLQLAGATPQLWEELNQPDCFGYLGFARFTLSNNSANIRNTKKRLEQLQKISAIPASEEVIKGITYRVNPEAGRVQLEFPAKPDAAVRKRLKKIHGFRWCSTENAWQRHLNYSGIHAAKAFLASY